MSHYAEAYGAPDDRPHTQFVYADVFPDGRVPPNPTILGRGSPAPLFPRLPNDAREAKTGWVETDADGTKTATPAGPNRFTVDVVSPMDKVYSSTLRRLYTFDPARGLVVGDERQTSLARGHGNGTGTTKLTSVKAVAPGELAKLASEADGYFAAIDAYNAALWPARRHAPDSAKAKLDAAFAALKSSAAGATLPELKAQYAERLGNHDATARAVRERIEREAEILGKLAYDFEATDLNGKPVKLADLKGQVVVMDFWYRTCSWCVKAMPQVNGLVDDFRAKPVAVLGMNTDRAKTDAEFVAKAMGLKYPTICVGDELPEEYGVRTFPTLVIIDKRGVVRDLQSGYSATLRADVGKVVRELLAEKP